MFQSTRPRGARRTATQSGQDLVEGFNPRARGGRDAPNSSSLSGSMSSFNPRARGGRDELIGKAFVWLYKFQSTRPRGARLKRQ